MGDLQDAIDRGDTIDVRKYIDELPTKMNADVRDSMMKILERVAEERDEAIALQAEQIEKFLDSLKGVKARFALLGMALGTATGAMVAFAIAYRKAEAKYAKISDDEIDEMRTHYHAKIQAAEAQAQKLAPVKDIVTERGYAVPTETEGPPMAVQPPSAVSEGGEDDSEKPRTTPIAPVPVPERPVRNVFQEVPQVDHEWDWHGERRRRNPDIPYVIHVDEKHEMDYESVTLTYYTVDDVLCDDRDSVVDPDKRDELIGEGNLDRFGHGSNDASIVYVRNDTLGLVYEIVKSPNSFAEEVHGFSHEGYDRGNLERMKARERDEADEG